MDNHIKIIKTKDVEIAHKALCFFDNVMAPSMTSRNINLFEREKKIIEFGEVIVLFFDDKICGIASAYLNDNINLNAYLSIIVIDPNLQGKGYGKKLLNIIENLAIEKLMKKIILEVRKDNYSAIKFYLSMGYKKCDFNEQNNSFFMEKNL